MTRASLRRAIRACVVCGSACVATPAVAQESDPGDVARQLANPVSSLISVPTQANYDSDVGPDDGGSVLRVNIQPVVPVGISDDWNLISRTILPFVDRRGITAGGADRSGLGDTVQSFFFSPKAPTSSGWIWGAGPVLLLPTASDALLGSEKWGIGPTAVALKQRGPWTYGALVNHIESFAGESSRRDLSATFAQPFVTYITPRHTTFSVNLETTYDWESDAWSVPINAGAYQLLKFGNQLVQVGGGLRYWLESPAGGPEGVGFRFQFTLLFPK